jgi:hypothetical protein
MPAFTTVRIDDRIAKRQWHGDLGQKLRARDDDTKDGPPADDGEDGEDGNATSETTSSQRPIAHTTATAPSSSQQTESIITSSTSVSSTRQLSTSVSASNTPANVELTSIRHQPAPLRHLRFSSPQFMLTKPALLHLFRLLSK